MNTLWVLGVWMAASQCGAWVEASATPVLSLRIHHGCQKGSQALAEHLMWPFQSSVLAGMKESFDVTYTFYVIVLLWFWWKTPIIIYFPRNCDDLTVYIKHWSSADLWYHVVCVAGGGVAAVQGSGDGGSGSHCHALLTPFPAARQVLEELPCIAINVLCHEPYTVEPDLWKCMFWPNWYKLFIMYFYWLQ